MRTMQRWSERLLLVLFVSFASIKVVGHPVAGTLLSHAGLYYSMAALELLLGLSMLHARTRFLGAAGAVVFAVASITIGLAAKAPCGCSGSAIRFSTLQGLALASLAGLAGAIWLRAELGRFRGSSAAHPTHSRA